MKSEEYWERRAAQVLEAAEKKALKVEKKLITAYNKALEEVQKEITAFHARVFRNGEPVRHVDAVKANRLNKLQRQIQGYLKDLGVKEEKELNTLLEDVLKESQLMTIFNVQQRRGIGTPFLLATPEREKEILSFPWSGFKYSDRIWKDKERLASAIEETLTQGFIRGQDANTMADAVAHKMNVSKHHAVTLVRTESAHISAQGTLEGYKSAGVAKYQILATLDKRTSDICQDQDGKVYRVEDAVTGKNYPPFHPRCRTTTVAVFGNAKRERAARDEDGETIKVPADMTYKEWKEEFADKQTRGTITSKSDVSDILSQTKGLPEDYKQILLDRYNAGSETAKRVFSKYVSENVIVDGNYKDNASYDPNIRSIRINIEEDLVNLRGAGTSFFHEIGHYVDHMAAVRILGEDTFEYASHIPIGNIEKDAFRKAIFSDVDKYLKGYAEKNDLSFRKAQIAIKNRFSQEDSALYSAISDVYGGATGNALRGDYGHDNSYWNPKLHRLEKEAFAHMFEASFDTTGKRITLIEEYLSSAYQIFKDILEVI